MLLRAWHTGGTSTPDRDEGAEPTVSHEKLMDSLAYALRCQDRKRASNWF
jgi:hypothetical protein